ncbi:MAG TPA: arylsulfatase [Pirellulaceae bacterium]|nr:arylsulfatase [Pirellulaceae bacterium]
MNFRTTTGALVPRAGRVMLLALLALHGLLAQLDPVVRADDRAADSDAASPRRPNIVILMADDLGVGEVGCYGQARIRTPSIDRLASEGMRFLQAYAGSPVCAPSRCVLLTGRHAGHAFIRNNSESGGWERDAPEGQRPLPADETTLAERLKASGYATGAFGKWGLGGPGSTGHPCYQGFDTFYGYLCQRVAHNYYPTHLWRNHDVDILGNTWFRSHQKLTEPLADRAAYDERFAGPVYAPDRIVEQALAFVETHRDEPFLLYFATPVPHAALQVPNDSLDEYAGAFDETPYLGEKSYLPHPTPRAAYAAMVTRMDRDFGRLLERIESLGLSDDTIVIMTSDNGPTFNGGTDSTFFDSALGRRGLKTQVFEGGIRVPLIVRWPDRIAAGTTSEFPVAFQDLLPTLIEAIGEEPVAGLDGISLLPTWTGQAERQIPRTPLYWELGSAQALRIGDHKLVRLTDRQGATRTMLFDLASDPNETTDLSERESETLSMMLERIRAERTPSPEFPTPYDDGR